MPMYCYENISSKEKLDCCHRLKDLLCEKQESASFKELEHFLKIEKRKRASPASLSIVGQWVDIYRLDVNVYYNQQLDHLIVIHTEAHEQRLNQVNIQIEELKRISNGKIPEKYFTQLKEQVEFVLENEILEKDCEDAKDVLEPIKQLLQGTMTVEDYKTVASDIKSNRSAKSLDNLGNTMFLIGFALILVSLVALNVFAIPGAVIIALMMASFITASIGLALSTASQKKSLGKTVNDIAAHVEPSAAQHSTRLLRSF